MLRVIIAYTCLIWYLAVILVCTLGYVKIFRHYRSRPKTAVSVASLRNNAPHVTVIRPCTGLEPHLYECLAATFQQNYPRDKLAIRLCIPSHKDPAYPVLKQVLADHPDHDADIFIEEEDPRMHPDHAADLGPNPKIRNMSRAYREAKSDIVWIIDCNVWVGAGVAGRLVDTLCGLTARGATGPRYKFVHQLPLGVDMSETTKSLTTYAGGRLDEAFLASAHAKFYTAINTVAVAPCIVGKSNMFRRVHLDYLTRNVALQDPRYSQPPGLDYFSHNICEDHLVGDLLWRNAVPIVPDLSGLHDSSPPPSSSRPLDTTIRNHALLPGDPCLQPTANSPLGAYIARRARWLRVRKFTVPLATAVEPGTEALLCSLLGAWACTHLYAPAGANPAPFFCLLVLLSLTFWAAADYSLYRVLHAHASIEADVRTPAFACGPGTRYFGAWLRAWAVREALAAPVWAWAVLGGRTVVWRGRQYKVGFDARVIAVPSKEGKNEGGTEKTRIE